MPQWATGGTDRTWVHGFLSGPWANGERCGVGETQILLRWPSESRVYSAELWRYGRNWSNYHRESVVRNVLSVVWRKGCSVGKGTCYQPAPLCSIPGTRLVAEESTPIAQAFFSPLHTCTPPTTHTSMNEFNLKQRKPFSAGPRDTVVLT